MEWLKPGLLWIGWTAMKVIGAVLLIGGGMLLAKQLKKIAIAILAKSALDNILTRFLSHICYGAVIVLFSLAGLDLLGIKTTSFVAILGTVSLAVGLALQNSLSNFGAGVLLVLFKPFRVGDFVDAGGVTGQVEEITLFSTALKTPDQKLILIPNSFISGKNIVNLSYFSERRIDLIVKFSREESVEWIEEQFQNFFKENEEWIISTPQGKLVLSGFDSLNRNFLLSIWVKTEKFWDSYFFLMGDLEKRFAGKLISMDNCGNIPQFHF